MTPPAARKPSICTSSVKQEDLTIKPCGMTKVNDGLGGLTCPGRNEHILKYKTGFCANGNCEGSAPKSRAGKGQPTCSWWKRCPCECHLLYDEMFEMSGKERQLVDNSGYVVDSGRFKMPTQEERMAAIAASMTTATRTATVIESAAPGVTPPTLARSFTPTATGRAARGELASWVKAECDEWLVEQPPDRCTPVFIAEGIAKRQGFVKPPSVGAVDAVLKRWVTFGFAKVEKKPTRFVGYTDEGVRLGMEGCVDKWKRTRKAADSKAARGSLR